jgi:prepilin-type N-terminal cleavage/methylation domain-containing protein
MKFSLKKRQSGFTLVELGIVVAIAAIIIGIGLIVVPSILASTRANAEISELPTITTKIQRSFANQPNYAAVTQASIIGLNVFPTSVVDKTAGTVSNRWGGVVTVAAATLVNANDGVSITSTQIPTAECLQVGQGVEGTMRKITVGTTVVKADGSAAADSALLGTACNDAATATMIFVFGK